MMPDGMKWAAICGLVVSTILLTRTVGTSFAPDKPVHSSILILLCSAATLLLLSRLLSRTGENVARGKAGDTVQLEDVLSLPSPVSRDDSPALQDGRITQSLRKLRTPLFGIVCAVVFRVAVLRLVLANVQCATLTWDPLIPFAIACIASRHGTTLGKSTSPGDSSFDQRLARSPYRYVVATALVGVGGLIVIHASSSSASTYICPTNLRYAWLTPHVQHLGNGLDLAIVICIGRLVDSQSTGTEGAVSRRVRALGWALLLCAVIWILLGFAGFFASDEFDRNRALEISSAYLRSTLRLNGLFGAALGCSVVAAANIGTTSVVVLIAFVTTSTVALTNAWETRMSIFYAQGGSGLLGVFISVFGFASYYYLEIISEDRTARSRTFTRMPSWVFVMLFGVVAIQTGLWASRTTALTQHPIDVLIEQAQATSDHYMQQASTSTSLEDAVRTYRKRYSKHPPPGFNHWFSYARKRKSAVIDDFDGIHRDLAPFWSLSPENIRLRTWELISNPWHDASGISIRDGKVDISPNVMPTHRWMLEGIVQMISQFSQWLPDMDLAFNVNDECRVAVPYEQMEHMRQAGDRDMNQEPVPANAFSPNRAAKWKPIPEEPNPDRVMREMSWQHTFSEWGSITCPCNSPARMERHWDLSQKCTTCADPHTQHGFLSNWTLAGSPCHQPDLADLHGLFLSPAAFKATHELYPVFSQSKISGFNDILYPSAWNYMDKSAYQPTVEEPDPPFSEKDPLFFWRGSTTEGMAHPGNGGGMWQGMARQRFVQLSQTANVSASRHGYQVLLPSSLAVDSTTTYTLHTASNPPLTSIELLPPILRCAGQACSDQHATLNPHAEPVPFQTHWRHKYLLDLDGAGFSGRFLPFLRSRSLPFKAGLFREWYSDRLIAWRDFLPLDVRGDDLWGVLSYFAGVDGGSAREGAAERIAERGREWSERVLRKEDMEIYFFRLLLEWGRVTDEGREGRGFAA